MSYKIGDIVPYRSTRSNVKRAKITSLETVDNGKIWFWGIDTVTGAKVWYPVHRSEQLELQTKKQQNNYDSISKILGSHLFR